MEPIRHLWDIGITAEQVRFLVRRSVRANEMLAAADLAIREAAPAGGFSVEVPYTQADIDAKEWDGRSTVDEVVRILSGIRGFSVYQPPAVTFADGITTLPPIVVYWDKRGRPEGCMSAAELAQEEWFSKEFKRINNSMLQKLKARSIKHEGK